MNKKLLFIIILFLPVIVAGIWLLSVTGENFTVSNVSSVTFVYPDGTESEYIDEADKELFVELKNNIVSIDRQEFDDEVYSLYQLRFERVQGDITYYLCLSADVKNCLAYDEKGNWYRINKEYAGRFLLQNKISDVYRNSNIPVMTFSAAGVDTLISAVDAKWYYLLADESYAESLVSDLQPLDNSIYVIAGEGFDFTFDVAPDWYSVKIFDGDNMVYDGMLDSVTEFSYNGESKLRAVIDAEWYEDTTNLYHGEAVYEFYFDYDIKATYTVNKESFSSGEVAYISLMNANNEALDITSDIPGLDTLTARSFGNGQLIMVPIPMDTQTAEYRISVKSDKTVLSIPLNVNAKDYGEAKVGFIASESADEYSAALSAFLTEISSSFDVVSSDYNWIDSIMTPVEKFVNGVEQYWVSSPSYAAKQIVDGKEIDERNLGVHYVKSVAVDSLPVRSVAYGTIAFSGTTALYGNTVVIEHGFGFKTVYGHLDSLNFNVGDTIEAGAFIANARPSGFAVSSTEFFFGICVGNVFVNPYNFIVEPRSSDSANISEPIEFLVNLSAR